MRKNILKLLVAIIGSGLLSLGCNKWDDHNALSDEKTGKNLFEQIVENTELSKFAELLTKSGYDKVLASSKTYTVFAPNNSALATLDPAVIADTAKLRMFVSNHITNQLYQTSGPGQLRLKMLNGKYNNLQGKNFGDATITSADRYAKNGFIQVIDKMIPALPSAWDFLESSAIAPVKQKNYLLAQFRNVFDLTNAIQTGINPTTGDPIYKPGSDSIRINTFWRDVYDLRDESKQYTFFMLTDAAWDAEVNKFKPFFVTGTADSTTNLASNAVLKDLAVEGVYLPESIPDTILSKFNTKAGIQKSAIVQTIKVSNGIVYIMSSMNVLPKHKFLQIVIQGENYNFSRFDRRGNTFFRDKFNPLTGMDFRDVVVMNHGVAEFYLGYNLPEVPAIKYKAYWVALHDNINNFNGTYKQRLSAGTPFTGLLVTVSPNDYREIYLGELTVLKYSPVLNLFLTADNSTSVNANILSLDYIRLEPVL